MVVAVFPGRFDPVTHGHLDIIKRSASLFSRVIVGVIPATGEKMIFSLTERIKMLEHLTSKMPNILVVPCREPVLDFAQKHQARVIIKGLRCYGDFEMEFERAKLNKELAPEIETIFMTCRPELFYSSEMVKEIASFGGNISHLVPPYIKKCLFEKMTVKEAKKHRETVAI